jgi:hypothetical protein
MSNAAIRPIQPDMPIFREAAHKEVSRVQGLHQVEADYVVDSGLSLGDIRTRVDGMIEYLRVREKRATTAGAVEIG